MDHVRRVWSGFGRKLQSGQTMTEYALILGLVVIVAIAAYAALGGQVVAIVQSVTGSL